MTEPTKIQKVIAKIQQLRKISESTHSKAEKETTIALAAKLIAEYQLSEAEVAVKENVNEEIDLTNEHIIYETGRSTPWKMELVFSLAKLNGLFAYSSQIRHSTTHKRATRYRVIGRISDIEIARYMFDYLVSTIQELVNEFVPTAKQRGVNPARESWCLGCVRGFIAKMNAEREKVNQTATSTALVFIGNKAKEAEEAFKGANKSIVWGKRQASKAQVTADTFYSGYRKGQTLTVNPGMGTTETKKLDR